MATEHKADIALGWRGMDQLVFLRSLDKLAGILRGFGLHPIPRLGKHLLKLLLRNDLIVNADGFWINGYLAQRGYLYGLQNGTVEGFMADMFKRVVKPGMVVLDIGAYLGWYTLLAGRQVGPNGKVYAFEPDPRNFSLLGRNIQRNGLSDRAIAVPKAISDKAATASFFLHARDQSCSSLFDARGSVKETVVNAIALDEFLDKSFVVDVIKMDIQGAELHALKGMEWTIARASSKLTMFIECWLKGLRITDSSAGALVERLRELGFSVMLLDEQKRCFSPVGADIDSYIESAVKYQYVNLYCSRSKETQ